MSLGLHEECKRRLKEKLIQHFNEIKVENNFSFVKFTDIYFYLLETVLPETGRARKLLTEIIGEFPISPFVSSEILREVRYNYGYESDSIKDLSQYDIFSNVNDFAEYIIEYFDTLPFKYSFLVELPSNITDLFTENSYSIGSVIRICKPDTELIDNFKLSTGNNIVDRFLWSRFRSTFSALGLALAGKDAVSEELNHDKYYMQIFIDGYCDVYGITETTENLNKYIKAFFGLLLAERAFKIQYKYMAERVMYKIFVHSMHSGEWIIENIFNINDDIVKTLHSIKAEDYGGKLKDDDMKKNNVNNQLKIVADVFSKENKFEKIILACQWFFDSYSGTNELLSFIQAMITIEILLGEKKVSDLVGLTELLSNRCAYLIGKDSKQRSRILTEFREIYDIRSKIVHRGKSKITIKERDLLNRLQWICTRVIQEETKLILSESDS